MVSAVSDIRYISSKEAAKLHREKLKGQPVALARFEREEKTREELRERAKLLKPPKGTPTARDVELVVTGRAKSFETKTVSVQESKAIGAKRPVLKVRREPARRDIQLAHVVDIQRRQVAEQRAMPLKETIRTEPGKVTIHTVEAARAILKEKDIQRREKEFIEAPKVEKAYKTVRGVAFGVGGEQIAGAFVTDTKVSRAVAETEQKTYYSLGLRPTILTRVKVAATAPVPSILGLAAGGVAFGTVTKVPAIARVVSTKTGQVIIGGTFAYTAAEEAKHIHRLFAAGEKAKGIGAAGLSIAGLGGFVGGQRIAGGKPIIPKMDVMGPKDLKAIYGKDILAKTGLTEEMIAQKGLKIELVEPKHIIRPFKEPGKPTPRPKKPRIDKPVSLTPEEREFKDLFKFKYKDEPMIPLEPAPKITTGYIQAGEKTVFFTKTGLLETIGPKLKVKTKGKPKKGDIIKPEDILKPPVPTRGKELIIRKPLTTEKQIMRHLKLQYQREGKTLRVPEDLPKRGIKYEEVKVIKPEEDISYFKKARKGMASIFPVQRQVPKMEHEQPFITTQIRQVTPKVYQPRRQAFDRQFQTGLKDVIKIGQQFQVKGGLMEQPISKMKMKTPEALRMKEPLIFGLLPSAAMTISEKIDYSHRMMPITKARMDKDIPDSIIPELKPIRKVKASTETRSVSDVLFTTGTRQYIPEQIKPATPGVMQPKVKTPISDPMLHPGMPMIKTILGMEQPKIKDVNGYNVMVPVRGRLTKMNKGRMSRQQAMAFGGEIVDNTEAASFTIKRSGLQSRHLMMNLPSFDMGKFRYREKDRFFVEKNAFRIDTIGELHGISAKGWAKNRMRGARNISRLLCGF